MSETKNELDQTIEELEAEVLAELEESSKEESSDEGENLAEKESKVDEDKAKDLGGADGDEASTDKGDKEREIGKKVSAAAKKAADPKAKPSDASAKQEETETEEEVIAEEPKLKTKADHMAVFEKMKAAEMKAMYAAFKKLAEEDDEDEDEDEEEVAAAAEKKEAIEKRIKDIDVKEDVDALVSDEDALSEDFKTKAATIFEAAVKSKVRVEVERIFEEMSAEKDEAIEKTKDDLTEKVDTYLNYVVDEWTKENELAIERGLKGEIAEDFIAGLKQLFEDHYIDVPDEKYDVLEAQSEKIAELEEKLNVEIQKNIEIKEANSQLVRDQLIQETVEDLVDTEAEKFKELTNDVEFSDEEGFRTKLSTLKESYFPKVKPTDSTTSSVDDEETTGLAQDVDLSDQMAGYISAITKSSRK